MVGGFVLTAFVFSVGMATTYLVEGIKDSRNNVQEEIAVVQESDIYEENTLYQGDVPPVEFLMISQEANEGDVVSFPAETQSIYVRVTFPNTDITPSVGGFRVPEGYRLVTVDPVQKVNVYGESETIGYDAWFINEVDVEVTAVYDAYHGNYTFNTFGVPIEKENVKVY